MPLPFALARAFLRVLLDFRAFGFIIAVIAMSTQNEQIKASLLELQESAKKAQAEMQRKQSALVAEFKQKQAQMKASYVELQKQIKAAVKESYRR